jgi:muramoyltetrapeptide carboxypeptidase LdcA involved in peptidoglycan recycling
MIIPEKLKRGDEVRVVSPAQTTAIVSDENIDLAKEKLEKLGLKVTFSKNCRETDVLMSSSIKSRVDDLHEAFADKNVKAILTSIGGFNSNQLLKHLDYELIKNNPKILCGYSDITVLSNAITAKTGLVTYLGPHFSTWAMKQESKYNEEYFKKCLMSEGEFILEPSKTWSDDLWFLDQEKRDIKESDGMKVLKEGIAKGKIVGGNLGSVTLLSGTEFMPDLTDTILFIEDEGSLGSGFAVDFDRNLQALLMQKGFEKIKGLVIGMFPKNSEMTVEKIEYIIDTKEELKDMPIIYNVNFGHNNPIFTIPLGGTARISVIGEKIELKVLEH